MIAPWPGMRRGAEDEVPTVPGLVREIVVPWKSSGEIVPLRAFCTSSSKARTKAAKSRRFASLMLGTSRVRLPSFFCTSTAMPRRTLSRCTRWAWPSSSA